ncbi:hypothetical protein DTO282F9_5261 [Paecilomyces variotii]|nr:hypothetical protein DTO282F9_5261 [Paecilomyces variotii]
MAHLNSSPLLPQMRLTPAKIRRPSRSSSRSPERKSQFSYHVLDPLLSNLSPESTLEALTSVDAVPKNEKTAQDLLTRSISKVSTDERALGIRAAVAAKKLKEWYREVLGWGWPRKADAQLGKGFIPPTRTTQDESGTIKSEEEYFGSLPAEMVKRYETRIEEIRDGMDSLDVEELKEHVLNAHIPSRSRPSSSASTISVGPPSFSYVQLSDFTAIVTATILRLLPTLSRLNFLLTTWDVRLLVLRQIPGLLSRLEKARATMDSSMAALKRTQSLKEDTFFSRDAFHAKRVELEALVVSAGRRMDNILDALEGREDSLPEAWIDDLEAIEADFGTWAIEAEKRVVMNELMRLNKPKLELAVEAKEPEAPIPELVPRERPSKPETPASEVNSTPESQSIANTKNEDLPEANINAQEVSNDRKLVEISANISGSTSNTIPYGVENILTKTIDTPSDPISRTSFDNVQSETPKQKVDRVAPTGAADMTPQPSAIQLDQPADLDIHRPPRETLDDRLSDISEEMSTDNQVSPTGEKDLPSPNVRMQGSSHTSGDMQTAPEDLPQNLTSPSEAVTVFDKELEPRPVSSSNPHTHTSDGELSDDESTSSLGPAAQGDNQARISPTSNVSGDRDQAIRVENAAVYGDDSPSEDRSLPRSLALDGTTENESQSAPQQRSDASEDEITPSIEHLDRDTPTLEDISTPVVKPSGALNLPDVPTERLSDIATTKMTGSEDNNDSEFRKEGPVLTDLSQVAHDIFMGPSELQDSAPLEGTNADTPTKPEPSEYPPNSSPHGVPFSSLFSKPRDRSSDDARNQDRIGSVSTKPDGNLTDVDEESSPKLGLESPIRMSKLRPKPLSSAKGHPKPYRRDPSDVSGAESPISDYPSLLSSPETREAYTCGSPTTPLVTETPTPPRNDHLSTEHARSNSQATLRQEHLFNFDRHRGPSRPEFKHCRTASLPLQRFINEDVDQDYDDDFVNLESLERSPSPSPEQIPNDELPPLRKRVIPADLRRRAPAAKHSTSAALNFSTPETGTRNAMAKRQGGRETSESPHLPEKIQKPSSWKASSVPARSNKRLNTQETDIFDGSSVTGPAYALTPSELSRPASPSAKTTGDELEDKINSILNTLPARIHLTHAPTTDGPAGNSLAPSQRNERLGSVSPRWPSSRSSTPTPSLYLTPAYNRARRPRSYASEESSVRVYHLHRGKTAPPTKLFVRTVGEGGERVMVRVGGGWADLGEYLREYAIHHGSRRVSSDQQKVEVQEIPSHSSPSHSSPGSTLTQPSNNGRTTPSRPGSSLSSRSPSSLAVRKTRRPAAPVDELGDLPTADSQTIGDHASPLSVVSCRNRRLSVSSNTSISVGSTADSPFAGSSHSNTVTPLGLAGPKPRSRRMSMSPESEAWVEDVLGQARKNVSLKLPKPGATRTGRESSLSKRPSEPKLRSVSDIGTAGLNKRVLLRGLDRRRESSQGL